jgi:hypothetical protein
MGGMINFVMVVGFAVVLLWLAHRALPDQR